MGDGVEFRSHEEDEKKTLAEDIIGDELVGSDEARVNEEDVFEEAIGSENDEPEEFPPEADDALHEDSLVEATPESSKNGPEMEDFEEAVGDLDETSSNEGGVKDLKVDDTVNVQNKTARNAEPDFVNPKVNGDKGKAVAENSYGLIESSLDVVKNTEKADSNGFVVAAEDVNTETGYTYSSLKNGTVSPENGELVADVFSKSIGREEMRNDGIEVDSLEGSVDASACIQTEQEIEEGELTNKNPSEKGLVCKDNDSEANRKSEFGIDYRSNSVNNASGGKSLNDTTGVAGSETSAPSEKSNSEQNGESEGHNNCLRPEYQLASSLNSDLESTEMRSSSGFPGITCREHKTVQNTNGGKDVQQSPQPNKELEKQQSGKANIDPGIKERSHVEREPEVVSSASPMESRSNPTALSPARPAGLGRAAPLLQPAPRAPQQPRVNGSVSHNHLPQQAEDSATSETDEHDETREKLQLIRVKFLRLAHRLGQTPHNVVVAQVLYRLGLAEQLRGRNGSRVGAFSFDRASAMAEQLEAAGQDPLVFSCTIMVLGKSGVGKSATINSIFDEMKFSTDAFQMGTKRVQDVEGLVQGIKVRVIDTPGLLPSWSDQGKNEKILNSVKAFIKKNPPDIVLYLDRLDMQSRDSGDMPLLRTISDVFGPSIWFNAIVGLTHAASVPPDGPNGTASSYDMFVTQRSHVIQQAIRQAAGDMRLMNPISLVENHSACRTNREGQRVLPNGQVWKPHLLLLSFASKILAEANALLKLQDNIPGRPFPARSKTPPLPFLLSSLLQSRPHPKLPEQQYGDEDEDDDLDESSDSDEESEYDQLPPFKRLTNDQMAKLSKSQKKQYLDEVDYREKLFMKKQMKEERKRRKMFKKFAAEIKDMPSEHSENVEEDSGGPASVPVPMPDLSLPATFDSDNPTHRYRYLDSSNQWLVRPVLETHGWDHDIGYEGVNAERLFVVKEKIPISFSGQVTKDKKDANVQLEMASSVKHGEGRSTSLGFDMQSVGKELAYTVRSETRFDNFRRNKAAAGLSLTLLGDSLSAGLKVENKLIAKKWFRMVMSGGAMTSRGDVAYGGSLEAQLRDKDYPIGRLLTTLGLSVMDWHGDLAIGGNIQSQVPIGRSSNLIARANLNNKGAGQVSVRVNSSEQLQLAMVALVPLFKKLLSYYSQQTNYGQ